MPDEKSIFFDEWRACLHAHYEYVIREGDAITEPTLRDVLVHSGFSETELDTIRAAILAGEGIIIEPLDAPPPGDLPLALEDDVVVDDSGDDLMAEDDPELDDLEPDDVAELEEDLEPEEALELDDPEDNEPPPPSQLSMF